MGATVDLDATHRLNHAGIEVHHPYVKLTWDRLTQQVLVWLACV